MDQQNNAQNNNQVEEKGFLGETIDYVKENPVTVAAGVAVIAAATLFISKKMSNNSAVTEIGSSMASAVTTKGSKAAKYALMMRH